MTRAMTLNPADRLKEQQHALEDLAAAWGLKEVPLHPETKKAIKKAAEWDIYAAEVRYTNPLQDIVDAPPTKWDALFDEATAAYTKTLMVEAADQKVRDGIIAAAAALLASPQQYDYTLEALPIEEVEKSYYDALERLGDTVNDLEKAIDEDHAAAHAYRVTTRKLQALVAYSAAIYPTAIHPAAIVVNTPDLFVLESWRGIQGNQGRANYDQTDLDNHRNAVTIKHDCAHGKNLDQLATGHWTNFSLEVARTHAELTRRAKALKIAGETRQLVSGEKPTEHRKGVGNTGRSMDYTEPTNEPSGWTKDN